jgi:hypothetical protein
MKRESLGCFVTRKRNSYENYSLFYMLYCENDENDRRFGGLIYSSAKRINISSLDLCQ